MKTIVYFLVLITSFCTGQSQVAVTKVTKLPDSIKVKGKVVDAVQWTDSLGVNLIVTAQTGDFKSKIEGLLSQDLYADHYVLRNDSAIHLWHVYDYYHDCAVDINAKFLKKTFNVTDLNNNGKAEVWLTYIVGCTGTDVLDMKVIMHEGKTMYAMRGHNKSRLNPSAGGDYNYNYNFLNGPKVFKEFALKLWKANVEKPWWEE
jgi:hypothetical protein